MALKNFILGDLGSSPVANQANTGITSPALVFAIIGGIWLVAGIIWTIKSRKG